VIALLILIGLTAGYLMMTPLMNKVNRHRAANAFRLEIGLPTKTLRRTKK
jgi:hypothetical protein